MDLLGDRAFCYHVNDFRVDGDNLEDEAWLSRGFSVLKARLGVAGRVDSNVEESSHILDSD